ncbi:alpha/beta fold hydrolase [Massilia sp. TSP1-1-2]|uniref:alpha/beta fold hydrolase n=1 Tax=Massilia sp. TSP1-1-2 TaxID=2804649 RepID=UPI003CE7416C
MPYTRVNGVRIAYQTSGDPAGPPLLLIMGLGMQLTGWPEDFVEGLTEQGFYVIRFDNRDIGLSDKFEHAGTPNVPLAMLKMLVRWPLKGAYTLADMARDAVGVLDALGVAKAHVVGASMGGMIAQVLAAAHPARVLTLTSIMSSSGRRGLPGPTRAARAILFQRPKAAGDFDRMVAHGANVFRVIGSPAYPTPEKVLRARVGAQIRRNVCPGGVLRQMLAIAASGDRSALLHSICAPTLVIHGAADPLVPLACGADTARQIAHARLEVIEGMGHDLPSQLTERLVCLIDAHAHGKMDPYTPAQRLEKQ